MVDVSPAALLQEALDAYAKTDDIPADAVPHVQALQDILLRELG